ncbi:MAG: thermitase [Acidimicrobiaceae bacterium]
MGVRIVDNGGVRSKVTRWGALLLVLGAAVGFAGPARATPEQPNDPAFGLQWNLRMIGAPAAWQVATGAGSTIAIVDTGVDLNHSDLEGKIIGHVNCIGAGAPGGACKDGSTAGQDDNGHGTHVAGIAAAATDNQTGVAGTAPDASILAVKVLDSTGSGSADDVAAGIRYAADHGASVINLSLGNISQSVFGASFQQALDDAFAKGALPIIAAGNNFVLPSGPIAHAIVVGALNQSGIKASYSNIQSSRWSIMAPGGEPDDTDDTCANAPMGVLSTFFHNGYACLAGTSMAAPHVAGAAAVLHNAGVLDPQQIVDKLLSTARALPTTSFDGAGALDLAAAVGQPATPAPGTTPDTIAPPDSGGANTPGSSSDAVTPSGDLNGPAASNPAGVTLPSERAAPPAGRVTTRTPPNADDGLSTGVVVVAVLMAAGVSGALGWFFIRGQSWARRTPPLDR